MTVRYAKTINGFTTSTFTTIDNLSVQATIANTLGRMDGAEFHSWLLWRLPQGKTLEQVIRKVASKQEPTRFMQCAGSASAMTVEIREIPHSGGSPVLYTIGTPTRPTTKPALVDIPWAANVVRVKSNEVFTAAEAAELFIEYFDTDMVARGWALRPTL